MAAVERHNYKRAPFHPFVTFDTSTLAALTLGHTVLAQACMRAGIEFSQAEAHSAIYDTEKTADLLAVGQLLLKITKQRTGVTRQTRHNFFSINSLQKLSAKNVDGYNIVLLLPQLDLY